MEIVDVVLHSIFIFTFLYLIYTTRKKSINFFKRLEDWDKHFSDFSAVAELHNADITFKNGDRFFDVKKKSENYKQDIVFIDDNINTGYDFVIVKAEKGTIYPNHLHEACGVYFYVLKGEISIKTSSINNILGPHHSQFIPCNEYHEVEVLKDCKYILIIHPPLTGEAS